MDNTFNMTLDDVKDFLSILGYSWNGAIIKDNRTINVDKFENYSNDFKNIVPIKLSYNDEKPVKDIKITPTSFEFYLKSIDLDDIDAVWEYEVDTDYTEQWVKFLLNTYGEDYKNYVKKYCKSTKQIEVNKAKHEFDKIKEIKTEILRKLKAKLHHIQKLEDLVNNTNELKK